MKSKFSVFENESEVLEVGGLTIENRLDRISLYGTIDITKDVDGLKAVTELLEILKDAESALIDLKHRGLLPDRVEVEQPEIMENPFSS